MSEAVEAVAVGVAAAAVAAAAVAVVMAAVVMVVAVAGGSGHWNHDRQARASHGWPASQQQAFHRS
jgi:hypothetical protein